MAKKILICDDHPAIVEVTCEILKREGYNVVTTMTTKNIFSIISEEDPDLILLDLRMPIKGGDIITRELKENQETKNIPVVIYSADHKSEDTARKAGADGFLCKPFEIDYMLSLIKEMTQQPA